MDISYFDVINIVNIVDTMMLQCNNLASYLSVPTKLIHGHYPGQNHGLEHYH